MLTKPIKPYTLQEDHKEIKQTIKQREKRLDKIVNKLYDRFISQNEISYIREDIEEISNEMYSINF